MTAPTRPGPPDIVRDVLDDPALPTLLAGCADRDPDAFAEFYRRTSPLLHLMVRAHQGVTDEAEDILVELYQRIWCDAAELRPGSSPREWTLTVLFRTLVVHGQASR